MQIIYPDTISFSDLLRDPPHVLNSNLCIMQEMKRLYSKSSTCVIIVLSWSPHELTTCMMMIKWKHMRLPRVAQRKIAGVLDLWCWKRGSVQKTVVYSSVSPDNNHATSFGQGFCLFPAKVFAMAIYHWRTNSLWVGPSRQHISVSTVLEWESFEMYYIGWFLGLFLLFASLGLCVSFSSFWMR